MSIIFIIIPITELQYMLSNHIEEPHIFRSNAFNFWLNFCRACYLIVIALLIFVVGLLMLLLYLFHHQWLKNEWKNGYVNIQPLVSVFIEESVHLTDYKASPIISLSTHSMLNVYTNEHQPLNMFGVQRKKVPAIHTMYAHSCDTCGNGYSWIYIFFLNGNHSHRSGL